MFKCCGCGGSLEPDTMEELFGVCDACLERRIDASAFACCLQTWIDDNCQGVDDAN